MTDTPRSQGNGILVEVSPGELIDKISILEIKSERIDDPTKLENVRYQLDLLVATRDRALAENDAREKLERDLKAINEELWVIEDDIRDREAAKDFGPTFIELARSVYKTNDRRAAVKKALDELYGSAVTEEKSYKDYGA